MKHIRHRGYNKGFALPTVMIASVVMLAVLLSGLVSASSVNVALKNQYYQKLADEAAESGGVFAYGCLKRNNYTPQWSSNSLKPNTDCTGAEQYACPLTNTEARCGVVNESTFRSTFEVFALTGSGSERTYRVTGTVTMLRTGRVLASSQQVEQQRSIVFKNNVSLSRPAKRFWLFGNNAGIDFNTSGNSASLTSVCATSCIAGEGATVISTKTGTLQFWTDGRTIWNRIGQPMSNGGGLIANPSTTQAAAVFPIGSDETRYVVITNTTENSVTNVGRLYYSVVDMTGDSGRGAVTTKNSTLGTGSYSSEALAAAPKSDGTGYWVLTYTPYTLAMVVFSFDNNGIPNQTPISQPANTISPSSFNGYGGFGTLNFNADYSRLVMMAGDHCISGACSTREGVVRLMSFNSTTGQVSYTNNWQSYPEGAGYSADFSPNGNYVYTSAIYPGRLARFTVTTGSSDATIKASQTYIGVTQPGTPTSCTGGGQILRAPDDKMYVANCGHNALSVVTAPDAASPGYQYGTFALGGSALSTYGLPQMVTIYSPTHLRY